LLTKVGMGLSPAQRASVVALADKIFSDELVEELLAASSAVPGDAISSAFQRAEIPYARRVQIVLAFLERLEERLAASVTGTAVIAALEEAGSSVDETLNASSRPAMKRKPALLSRPSARSHKASEQTAVEATKDPASNLIEVDKPLCIEDEAAPAFVAVPLQENIDGSASDVDSDLSTPLPVTLLEARLEEVESAQSIEPAAESEQNDFDPKESAEAGYEKHDGAILRRLDDYSYWEGQGALRVDAPPGAGPVRLCRGYRWHYSSDDGLWRDEARAEWQVRARLVEDHYFAGFDTLDAEPVANPLPQDCRGYAGPGRSLYDLQQLARTLRPAGPYQPALFEPDDVLATPFRGEQRTITIEKIEAIAPIDVMQHYDRLPKPALHTRPTQRLLALSDPTFADSWQTLPPISEPQWRGFRPSTPRQVSRHVAEASASEPMAEPLYAATAQQLRARRKLRRPDLVRRGPDDIDTPMLQGYSWLLSGPSGSGKSYRLVDIAVQIDAMKNYRGPTIAFFFLNMRTPKDRMPGEWRDLHQIDDLIAAAAKSFAGGNTNILFVDEYAELSGSDLAKLRPFHQIIMAGDYSQGIDAAQPAIDFMRRAGGGSSVLSRVWRGKREALFDLVSVLAYDGQLRSLSSPTSFKYGDKARACFVNYSPDDAQCEAVLAYLTALPHLDAGRRIIIVVDGKAAEDAINSMAYEESSKPRHKKLEIFGSHELRGRECDILIVATASLDRAGLSTDMLLERLIVLLGRATVATHFIMPIGEVLGSSARRFSCLVQPLLSYRVRSTAPTNAPQQGLASALAKRGLTLAMLQGTFICDVPGDDNFMPKMVAFGDEMHPLDVAMARHKGWRVIKVDIDLLHLDAEALEDDERFAVLLEALQAPKTA
jgi:hypothetical protein